MRIYKLFKNEDGGVLPFVALLLAFLLIGFVALVIDAGMLYAERRSMVTAADAAALGGAQILEESLADPDIEPIEVDPEAIKVAKDLGVANGVKSRDDIQVDITWNDPVYHVNIIKVKVKNNSELFFAKIFGTDNSDVTAEATATWGYDHKIEGGDILPLFTKEEDYQTAENTYLLSGKFVGNKSDIINGNWGLIDIFGRANDIRYAFSGEDIGQRMELDYTIDNKTGQDTGKIIDGIEDRMKTANLLTNKEDRVKFMTGLVPVIDWDTISKHGSSLKLPIKYFAVFEIYDVIAHGAENNNHKSTGSEFALYDKENYKSDGIAIEYDKVNGKNLETSTIIGKFTNDEPVAVRAIMEPGDQNNPNPKILSATYSKLIE
jgi:Flp pilus assembly protein TadG